MPPLVFEPRYWNRLWGGRGLQTLLGRKIPEGLVGESWEVSAHPQHVSRVAEGPFAGQLLTELWRSHRDELDGRSNVPVDRPFPLLIKLLDCQQPLSIQVHPNAQCAAKWCPQEAGKSEAWVVLETGAKARILAGLRPGVTRDDLLLSLSTGRVADCLNEISPQAGDCIAIEPGTLHALLGPVVLLEVQPTSDATFRLFDWNRVGLDGQPRQLHVDESLAAIDWSIGPINVVPRIQTSEPPTNSLTRLVSSREFCIDRQVATRPVEVARGGPMSVWLVVSGQADLRDQAGYSRQFRTGDTVLIPTAHDGCQWVPQTTTEFLIATPPNSISE